MAVRRYFKHMLVVFCVLTLGTAMALAAPACSSLFETLLISDESTAHMNSAIQDLAEMKFRIDTSKASGLMHNSPAAKHAAVQFEKKYQEILRANQGQLSEKELRLRIQAKIEIMQGTVETKDLDLQNQVKAQQDKAVHPYVQTRVTLEGTSAKAVSNSFEPERVVFLPRQNLVLEGRQIDAFNMDVLRIDARTGKESIFRNNVRSFKVSKDKQKGLFIFENNYEVVDLNTMQTIQTKEFMLDGDRLVTTHHEVSPDFSRMIFTDTQGKRFVIVDIATGEIRKTIEEDDIAFDVIQAQFIDNRTLLLFDPVFASGNKGLATLHLDTMTLIKHPIKENIMYFLSPERSEVTVFIRNKIENKLEATIFNALNLMPLKKLTVSNEVNSSNRAVLVSDPANASHVILYQRGKYLKFVDANEINKALYNFDETYNFSDGNSPIITGVDISPDGKEIVIRSDNHLDIWRVNE